MELDYFFKPPAMIRERKKYENFTLQVIGGPDEIKVWRAAQEAREQNYKLELKARDIRLVKFEGEIGEKLANPKIHTTSWAEKEAFARVEQEELKRRARIFRLAMSPKRERELKSLQDAAQTAEIKPTLSERFKCFVKNLWKSANFN
jgi:hypothetical protein